MAAEDVYINGPDDDLPGSEFAYSTRTPPI